MIRNTGMNIKRDIMLIMDRISHCGREAVDEVHNLCKNVQPHTESHLAICQEVLSRWLTTKNFKVGDKVYVHPGRPTVAFTNYIRATVTEINGEWGYHLRAFKQDLPGIFMFNIWDKDLLPRTNKSNKPLPPETEFRKDW